MSGKRGIVLFAHGSRDARWREPMEAVAAQIAVAAPDIAVCCAYLEITTPDLAGAVNMLVANGVAAIEVLPLFLGVGKHLREDLPLLLDAQRAAHPGVGFTLRTAVGELPETIAFLADVAMKMPEATPQP